MVPRHLLAVLVPAFLLAFLSPAVADQVKGVVKSVDIPGATFVIQSEEEDDDNGLMTFSVPEGVDVEDFMGEVEVGDDVQIQFDPDGCGDDPDCIDQATEIEAL